jgi:hypothetical protein
VLALHKMSYIKELQEAANTVFTTTKAILGVKARHSRVAIVGGFVVVHLTDHYWATSVNIKNFILHFSIYELNCIIGY